MKSLAAAFTVALLAGSITPAQSREQAQAIAGGAFEASGVVSSGNGVLFVDDSQPDSVYWMPIDESGRQAEAARPLALGVAIRDLEGITTSGSRIYVVGSQSKKDSQPGAGIARFTFDEPSGRIGNLESVAGLKSMIFSALPDVRKAAGSRTDGFNIEGLAWDPERRRLLLGLRAPLVDGQALIIPLQLRNEAAPLEPGNIVIAADAVIRLSLDGAGIRSLEYDAAAQTYRIIAGATNNKEAGFALWRWSGSRTPEREPVDATLFASELKPEGITRVSRARSNYTFVVFDTGKYAVLR